MSDLKLDMRRASGLLLLARCRYRLAAALCQLGRQSDPRGVMVSLALCHVVAQKLGL